MGAEIKVGLDWLWRHAVLRFLALQTGVMILFTVMAGFALHFLKDFSETLGARGQIPLLVAAWTPPVAAILLALGLLLHLEDG